jgi:hypothetical protein
MALASVPTPATPVREFHMVECAGWAHGFKFDVEDEGSLQGMARMLTCAASDTLKLIAKESAESESEGNSDQITNMVYGAQFMLSVALALQEDARTLSRTHGLPLNGFPEQPR